MSDPLQEIRASFFVECEELLEALQDGLGELEGGGGDGETIHVVFRAVHSIKGGAGAFGLGDLVGFAHAFETVLDEVRADRLEPTPELFRLFFRGADVLSDLVRAARDDTPADLDRVTALLAELEVIGGGAGAPGESDTPEVLPSPIALDLDLALPPTPPAPKRWRIEFHPHAGLYEAGHEPLFLLRALAALGITYDSSHCPALVGGDCRISLGPDDRDPVGHMGVIEVPVGSIGTVGGGQRHAQITALTLAEMLAAIRHARDCGRESFTLVSHSFELFNRRTMSANAIVRKRFTGLIKAVAGMRKVETGCYTQTPPTIRLTSGRHDPLPPSAVRTGLRLAEQFVSNALYGAR